MAARVFFLSILFTEVLRPACLAGIKGVSSGVVGLDKTKCENLEFQSNEGLGLRLDNEPRGDVVVGWEETILNCSGGPNQNVTWFRNDTAAPPCGLVRCNARSKGELRLKMGQKHGDRGNKNILNHKPQSPESYRCVVKNSIGALRSTPAILHIPYLAHEFNVPPQNVTVHEGEVARLSCFIDSIPSPPNITWLHEKKPLSFDDKSKYFMVSPGVLYINATKLSDAGSYRCVVTNQFLRRKTRKSKEAYLHVDSIVKENKSSLNLPTLLFPQISYSYRVVIGSNLKLVCASSGFPSLGIIWTFNSYGADDKTFLLTNSTKSIAVLTLKNIKIEHTGDYLCSVTNFGRTQTQRITVEVLVPPTFIKKPIGLSQCSGQSIRFECQAQGYPTPEIYWLKDSKLLDMHPRQGTWMKENNRMQLTISSTIPADSGIYQCVAVNSAGEIWAAARLQVSYSSKSPPAPTSLNCRAVSQDKILLSWKTPQAPSSFNNIASWVTVHYTIMEPGSRENTILPEENKSSIELSDLQPFTNYSMYVRKWIKPAASNPSNSIQCSTAASVPIAAPKVTVDLINSTNINVSWIPLNRREARGYVVEYKLQWRLKDHPSTKVRNLSSDITHYILTDLTPGTHYEVRVLARTKQGWPNVSDSLFNWTSVMMPLANPSQYPLTKLVNLDVTNVNMSTIKVQWKINEDTVKQRKKFDSWKLYYQNGAGKKLSVVALPKNCTEYLFPKIEADDSYGIGLCMITSGEPELCLLSQLDSKKPVDYHALTDVEGIPASSTSVNLTWSAIKSNIEHCYEVCYNAVYSVVSESPICINTTEAKITINLLKPYTAYQFKVRVVYINSVHESPYSETIECYTDEDGEESANKLLRIDEKNITICKVPGTVKELDWVISNGTEVRISWKQPSKANGVIQNYTVSYMNAPLITPPELWPNVTVPGNKTMVNLPGLAHGTLYFVQVRAATNSGYGKSSQRIVVRIGTSAKNPTGTQPSNNQPSKPDADQSLGIIVGVSISTCCIIICLSSIYCRRKWENTHSPRESSQTLKDRVILRNGNGCCVERTSLSNNQHVPTAAAANEIELAVLCPRSPKTTNSYDRRLNGIVEPCVKEPLLTPWPINGESKDLNITENPQYKPRSSSGSNQQPEQELDGTQITTLNYTATSSGSSLNNNLENSESLSSLEQQVPSTSIPVVGPNGTPA